MYVNERILYSKAGVTVTSLKVLSSTHVCSHHYLLDGCSLLEVLMSFTNIFFVFCS